MTDTETIEVRHAPERHRYEIVVDGVTAGYAEYEDHGDRLAITHTRVDKAFGGRGIGTRLVVDTLDAIRADGKKVEPVCPFVVSFLDDHPEYQDLVA